MALLGGLVGNSLADNRSKPDFQLDGSDISKLKCASCASDGTDPCAVQLQLLIEATAALKAAEDVAKEAYKEYYICVNGTPPPEPETPPTTERLASILEAVK